MTAVIPNNIWLPNIIILNNVSFRFTSSSFRESARPNDVIRHLTTFAVAAAFSGIWSARSGNCRRGKYFKVPFGLGSKLRSTAADCQLICISAASSSPLIKRSQLNQFPAEKVPRKGNGAPRTFHSKPTRAGIFYSHYMSVQNEEGGCVPPTKVSISTFPAKKRARAQPHGLLSAHNAKLKPFLRLLTTAEN